MSLSNLNLAFGKRKKSRSTSLFGASGGGVGLGSLADREENEIGGGTDLSSLLMPTQNEEMDSLSSLIASNKTKAQSNVNQQETIKPKYKINKLGTRNQNDSKKNLGKEESGEEWEQKLVNELFDDDFEEDNIKSRKKITPKPRESKVVINKYVPEKNVSGNDESINEKDQSDEMENSNNLFSDTDVGDMLQLGGEDEKKKNVVNSPPTYKDSSVISVNQGGNSTEELVDFSRMPLEDRIKVWKKWLGISKDQKEYKELLKVAEKAAKDSTSLPESWIFKQSLGYKNVATGKVSVNHPKLGYYIKKAKGVSEAFKYSLKPENLDSSDFDESYGSSQFENYDEEEADDYDSDFDENAISDANYTKSKNNSNDINEKNMVIHNQFTQSNQINDQSQVRPRPRRMFSSTEDNALKLEGKHTHSTASIGSVASVHSIGGFKDQYGSENLTSTNSNKRSSKLPLFLDSKKQPQIHKDDAAQTFKLKFVSSDNKNLNIQNDFERSESNKTPEIGHQDDLQLNTDMNKGSAHNSRDLQGKYLSENQNMISPRSEQETNKDYKKLRESIESQYITIERLKEQLEFSQSQNRIVEESKRKEMEENTKLRKRIEDLEGLLKSKERTLLEVQRDLQNEREKKSTNIEEIKNLHESELKRKENEIRMLEERFLKEKEQIRTDKMESMKLANTTEKLEDLSLKMNSLFGSVGEYSESAIKLTSKLESREREMAMKENKIDKDQQTLTSIFKSLDELKTDITVNVLSLKKERDSFVEFREKFLQEISSLKEEMVLEKSKLEEEKRSLENNKSKWESSRKIQQEELSRTKQSLDQTEKYMTNRIHREQEELEKLRVSVHAEKRALDIEKLNFGPQISKLEQDKQKFAEAQAKHEEALEHFHIQMEQLRSLSLKVREKSVEVLEMYKAAHMERLQSEAAKKMAEHFNEETRASEKTLRQKEQELVQNIRIIESANIHNQYPTEEKHINNDFAMSLNSSRRSLNMFSNPTLKSLNISTAHTPTLKSSPNSSAQHSNSAKIIFDITASNNLLEKMKEFRKNMREYGGEDDAEDMEYEWMSVETKTS